MIAANIRAFSVRAQTFYFGELSHGRQGFFERSFIVFDDAGAALELIHG